MPLIEASAYGYHEGLGSGLVDDPLADITFLPAQNELGTGL